MKLNIDYDLEVDVEVLPATDKAWQKLAQEVIDAILRTKKDFVRDYVSHTVRLNEDSFDIEITIDTDDEDWKTYNAHCWWVELLSKNEWKKFAAEKKVLPTDLTNKQRLKIQKEALASAWDVYNRWYRNFKKINL